MQEIFVSQVIFDNNPEPYVALTDEKEQLILVVGPMSSPGIVEQAHHIRLSLELTSGIPTELLEEIRSRQFTPQERLEILRRLRVAWYGANRMNRLPVRHVGVKANPEP
jgi:hypothetical protein